MASSRWLNPPFDPRILSIGTHNRATPLKRGYIIVDNGKKAGSAGAPGMQGKGVRFLYNPVAVSVSHTVDPGALVDSDYSQKADNKGQMGTVLNIGSLSIDLLYDRTYELWDSSKKGTMAGQYGVYADVLGFYQMTGVVRAGKTTPGGPLRGGYDYGETGFNEFPKYQINPGGRYYLYFGDKVRWYGTLTDLSITYSHWTQNMVPSRCSISVGMMFQTDSKDDSLIIPKGKNTHTVPKGGTAPSGPQVPGTPGINLGADLGLLGPLGG